MSPVAVLPLIVELVTFTFPCDWSIPPPLSAAVFPKKIESVTAIDEPGDPPPPNVPARLPLTVDPLTVTSPKVRKPPPTPAVDTLLTIAEFVTVRTQPAVRSATPPPVVAVLPAMTESVMFVAPADTTPPPPPAAAVLPPVIVTCSSVNDPGVLLLMTREALLPLTVMPLPSNVSPGVVPEL